MSGGGGVCCVGEWGVGRGGGGGGEAGDGGDGGAGCEGCGEGGGGEGGGGGGGGKPLDRPRIPAQSSESTGIKSL